ncbi:myelin basic protein [Camelus ferus]|nr:myelin basic protein [Camelus ferus]
MRHRGSAETLQQTQLRRQKAAAVSGVAGGGDAADPGRLPAGMRQEGSPRRTGLRGEADADQNNGTPSQDTAVTDSKRTADPKNAWPDANPSDPGGRPHLIRLFSRDAPGREDNTFKDRPSESDELQTIQEDSAAAPEGLDVMATQKRPSQRHGSKYLASASTMDHARHAFLPRHRDTGILDSLGRFFGADRGAPKRGSGKPAFLEVSRSKSAGRWQPLPFSVYFVVEAAFITRQSPCPVLSVQYDFLWFWVPWLTQSRSPPSAPARRPPGLCNMYQDGHHAARTTHYGSLPQKSQHGRPQDENPVVQFFKNIVPRAPDPRGSECIPQVTLSSDPRGSQYIPDVSDDSFVLMVTPRTPPPSQGKGSEGQKPGFGYGGRASDYKSAHKGLKGAHDAQGTLSKIFKLVTLVSSGTPLAMPLSIQGPHHHPSPGTGSGRSRGDPARVRRPSSSELPLASFPASSHLRKDLIFLTGSGIGAASRRGLWLPAELMATVGTLLAGCPLEALSLHHGTSWGGASSVEKEVFTLPDSPVMTGPPLHRAAVGGHTPPRLQGSRALAQLRCCERALLSVADGDSAEDSSDPAADCHHTMS